MENLNKQIDAAMQNNPNGVYIKVYGVYKTNLIKAVREVRMPFWLTPFGIKLHTSWGAKLPDNFTHVINDGELNVFSEN